MATVNEINVIDNLEKRLVDLGYTQNKLHDQIFAYLGDLGLNQPTLTERLNMYGGWYRLTNGELPPAYLPQVERLFEAFDVQPSDKQKRVLNNFYKDGLAGIMHKMDGVFIYHSHDAQASLINWRNPDESAVAVNSPVFTPYSGWNSDGVSAHIRIPTALNKFKLTDAHFSASQATATGFVSSNWLLGDSSAKSSSRRLGYGPVTEGGSPAISFNSSNVSVGEIITAGQEADYLVCNRAVVGSYRIFRDGVFSFHQGRVAESLPTTPLFSLRWSNDYSPVCIANILTFGGSLTDQEIEQLSSAWATFKTEFAAD